MIDHLVYTVPNLTAACDELEARLGVRPVPGGRHLTRGTHNALVKLDQGVYLEILAADEQNKDIPPPRWMGVDRLTGPKITRWAQKSDDLETLANLLRGHDPNLGEIAAGHRALAGGGELRWRMVLPTPTPEVDILPFFIDWSTTEVLPYDALPEMGCGLVQLFATHPVPEVLQPLLVELGANIPVIEAPEPGLRAVIRCPNGIVEL